MKAHAADAEPPLEVDMTPLIDVVFLLLIFFMLVSVFNEMEREAKVELPDAYQVLFDEDIAKERTIVNVETDGRIVMYGQAHTVDQFKARLAKIAALLRSWGSRTGEAPIVLRGHKDCEYRHIQAVIGAVYDAGIEKIMFAAYQKRAEDD